MEHIKAKRTLDPATKIAVVYSRFNSMVTEQLLEGAVDTVLRHGGEALNISKVEVPGSYEMPIVVKKLLETGKYDGIICVGAVIRGGTPHFEFISSQVASGLTRVGLDAGVPVSFGVLTTDTVEQALDRSGLKAGNKGEEAALALIETLSVINQISGDK